MLSLPEVPWHKIAIEPLGGNAHRVRVLEIERDDEFEEVLGVVADCLANTGGVVSVNAGDRTAVVTISDYAAFFKNLVFEGIGVAD